jgi:tRNA(fMet)-specific endonuclease VapC
MKYLLDTNICIYIINRKDPALLRKLQAHRAEHLCISTITIAELEHGVAKSKRPDQNRVALVAFLVPFTILDFDQAAAAEYGGIRAALESQGQPIGPMDLLLAAQARSRQLVLVSNNEAEFKRVESLEVENWVVNVQKQKGDA